MIKYQNKKYLQFLQNYLHEKLLKNTDTEQSTSRFY